MERQYKEWWGKAVHIIGCKDGPFSVWSEKLIQGLHRNWHRKMVKSCCGKPQSEKVEHITHLSAPAYDKKSLFYTFLFHWLIWWKQFPLHWKDLFIEWKSWKQSLVLSYSSGLPIENICLPPYCWHTYTCTFNESDCSNQQHYRKYGFEIIWIYSGCNIYSYLQNIYIYICYLNIYLSSENHENKVYFEAILLASP